MFAGYERYQTIPKLYQQTQDSNVLLYANNKVAIPRLEMFAETSSIVNTYRHHLVENLHSKSQVNMLL